MGERGSHGGHTCPERSTRVDSDRERMEAELRREAELGRIAGPTPGVQTAGEHRVERLSEDSVRSAARRGAREG